jgi:hypothetical protein
MSPTTPTVLIVGARPAGLTLAIEPLDGHALDDHLTRVCSPAGARAPASHTRPEAPVDATGSREGRT